MNVTIRVVHADAVSALPYAKQDMFAYGLYFNRELNDRQSKILEETTIDRIDLTVGLRGLSTYPISFTTQAPNCAGLILESMPFLRRRRNMILKAYSATSFAKNTEIRKS